MEIDRDAHIARTTVGWDIDSLRQQVARWEPRPCPPSAIEEFIASNFHVIDTTDSSVRIITKGNT